MAIKERPLDLNHVPLANFFQHLAHEATPKAKAILVKGDEVAEGMGLDDEVVDGVLDVTVVKP
jgi:hypothetical protein